MRQSWRDVVFLHWETDPESAQRWLPDGTHLDLHHGRTFVGLIGLRIQTALLGLVPVPHLGSFDEVNVRVYSVDDQGRRGTVFCSLDAERLLPVLAARSGYRLPYMWSVVRVDHHRQELSYSVCRRWPGADHPTTAFSVLIGERLAAPTASEHFVTARWAMHWRWAGRTMWCSVAHEPWPLHAAELLSFDDELIGAAGLPQPHGRPVSALWSPGVTALIGPPAPLR